MKKVLCTFLAALLLGLGITAQAGALADLSVISRATGRALPVYYHQGRYYVAGTPGEKYAVAVRNKTGQRIMTVMSVDGVNVVSGETAASEQTGYVLDRWLRYEINGWRKSTEEVAAFVFTALPDSYAARTERPGNVGVIGVAVFREYEPPRPAVLPAPKPFSDFRGDLSGGARSKSADAVDSASGLSTRSYSEAQNPPAPAAAEIRGLARMQPPEEKLGTGHGEREVSQVSYTDFRRASERPYEVISIYYDSANNLLARGIIPQAPRAMPNPFPGSGQFVPDPKG